MKKAFLCQRSTGMLFDIYNEGRTLFRQFGVSSALRSKASAQGRFIRPEQVQSPKGERPKGTNPAKPPSGGRAKWHVNSERSVELP